MFGLPGQTLTTPKRKLGRTELKGLSDSITNLSERIASARAKEPVTKEYSLFVAACLSQTDNIKPRQTRLNTLYKSAF
jgi:hypothetical protein